MTKSFAYKCNSCGYTDEYIKLVSSCPECGGEWLELVYNLNETAYIWRHELPQRDRTMWRYWELLPMLDRKHIVSMGEGWTPLLRAENLGAMLGRRNIFIKDERQGPTASFKDRQASLAISVLKEADIKELVVASTGNVAISYSAYCARSGIKLWAFLDSNVPHEKMREVTLYGTEVIKVSSNYDRTKQVAAQFAKYRNLFLDKGVKGISSREAMKTLAFEIAEQLGRLRGVGWTAPDWYIQAVSGGMGPIGVWQGFYELFKMGLIKKMPKLAIIQTEGCAPMVNSFQKGLETCEIVENPSSIINVLATGNPGPAYPFLRNLVLTYGGAFVKVDDQSSFRAMRVMAQMEGLSMEPAAAVACAGLIKMVQEQLISPNETVVVNASGHTFPVEKQILENEIVKSHIRVQNLEKEVVEEDNKTEHRPRHSTESLPQEGLLTALRRLDDRVQSIAIIEDEPDARILLRRILQYTRKYNIFEADDGNSGIKLIRAEKPDLVLLDLMMPGIDGFTILDMMKADVELRDIPVIVITAKDLTSKDYKRLSGRVESLLQKGEFMEEELFESIRDVLK
ncbi:MAG: pyridoxal-phosphate dependent enzyme [Anaerolineae bacterium]|nr:pyridoxal-phosphate dependent enzyme [Anaerolineae bacterium]